MFQEPISLHTAKYSRIRCLLPWVVISTVIVATGVVLMAVFYYDWAEERSWKPPLIIAFISTLFVGVVWLIVSIFWILNVCKPCWRCTDRQTYELLERDDLEVIARWAYSDEEWSEYTQNVWGQDANLPQQQIFSCCFGLCGRHWTYRQMLKQKGETIIGHGFIYFNGVMRADPRLSDSGVYFTSVTSVELPNTTLHVLRFASKPNHSSYIPIPSSVAPHVALELARTAIVPSVDVSIVTGEARRAEKEKQRLAKLNQKMTTLHPPSQRETCRSAFLAEKRQRYLFSADVFMVAIILFVNFMDPTEFTDHNLTVFQCIPSAMGILAFAIVFGGPRGNQITQIAYFILNALGVLCGLVVFGFIVSHFVELAIEQGVECDGRALDGWGNLSTAGLLLVVVLWVIPFRLSATCLAFVLSQPWRRVVAYDGKLKHAPQHRRLESLQLCWMRCIQALCMPTRCKTTKPDDMHQAQHVAQLFYEVIILAVCLATQAWLGLVAVGCGLMGSLLGLFQYHYLDVMCNSLAIFCSFIVLVFEITRMECQEIETAASLRLIVYIFLFAVIANSIRLSNVLKAYLYSENDHWVSMAEQYVNSQQYGDGPDIPYTSLHDPGENSDDRPVLRTSLVNAMHEAKTEGSSYLPPHRQRSLGSIMDSIGAPPPSEASSAASTPSSHHRSLLQERSDVAASSLASTSPSSRPFSVLQDTAEPDFSSVSFLPASTNAPPPSLASSSPPELSVSGLYAPVETRTPEQRLRKPSVLAIPHTPQAPPPSSGTSSPEPSSPNYSRSSAQLDQDQAARAPALSLYSGASSSQILHTKPSDPPPSPASTAVGGLPHVPSFPLIFRDPSTVSLSSSPSRLASTAAPPPSPQTSSPETISRNLVSFSYVAPSVPAIGSPRVIRTLSLDVTPPTSTVAPPPSPSSASASND